MTLRGPVAALLLVSGLAGCAQHPPEVSTAPAARKSIPSPLGPVSSLEDLRDAAVSAGMDCPQLTRDSGVYARESGHCTSQDRLQVYGSESGLKEDVEYLTKNVPGSTLLVGPNWMINTGDAEHLRAKIGGAVLTSTAMPVTAATPAEAEPATEPYGQWYEHEGLRVKIATPRRDPGDGSECAEPEHGAWRSSMTIQNLGKKERDLYDVHFFDADEDDDPVIGSAGKEVYLPGELPFDLTLGPGKTRTFKMLMCPVTDEFDATTPMTLQLLGTEGVRSFTLGNS